MTHFQSTLRTLVVVGLAAQAAPLLAQSACTVTKDQILEAVAAGATEDELYVKFGNCKAEDPGPAPGGVCTAQPAPAPTPLPTLTAEDRELIESIIASPSAVNPSSPPVQVITNDASVFYEAMTSCGYHPQRKMAACVIEIRQRFGFIGPPGGGPGSFEHVLLCVDLGAGLVPINVGSVHVHDEAFGVPPRWYFAALIPANPALAARPLNGMTYLARAILSWFWAPPLNVATCNLQWQRPWGNRIDFRIRLDP
jgi:hypothetical protein